MVLVLKAFQRKFVWVVLLIEFESGELILCGLGVTDVEVDLDT